MREISLPRRPIRHISATWKRAWTPSATWSMRALSRAFSSGASAPKYSAKTLSWAAVTSARFAFSCMSAMTAAFLAASARTSSAPDGAATAGGSDASSVAAIAGASASRIPNPPHPARAGPSGMMRQTR